MNFGKPSKSETTIYLSDFADHAQQPAHAVLGDDDVLNMGESQDRKESAPPASQTRW